MASSRPTAAFRILPDIAWSDGEPRKGYGRRLDTAGRERTPRFALPWDDG